MKAQSPFEAIRQVAEDGSSYWSARDLAKILGYAQYNKFVFVVKKAEEACRKSDHAVEDHFTHTSEMVSIGSGAKRKFDTVLLSRYACYLIIQNSDPEKEVVALGQTYFAIQTRRQELADEDVLAGLSEDQPIPTKSIQQLHREERKRLMQKQQPSLFDLLEQPSVS